MPFFMLASYWETQRRKEKISKEPVKFDCTALFPGYLARNLSGFFQEIDHLFEKNTFFIEINKIELKFKLDK